MPLWRCWWLYQSTNDATHRHASFSLAKDRLGESGRYQLLTGTAAVLNSDSEYGLSFVILGLEKDRRTPSSSNRPSSLFVLMALPLSAWRIIGSFRLLLMRSRMQALTIRSAG